MEMYNMVVWCSEADVKEDVWEPALFDAWKL